MLNITVSVVLSVIFSLVLSTIFLCFLCYKLLEIYALKLEKLINSMFDAQTESWKDLNDVISKLLEKYREN